MKRFMQENINTKEYWDKRYSSSDYDLGVDKTLHELIANQIVDGSTVVDYGCGPGEILNLIKKKRKNAITIGVDQSPYDDGVVEGSIYDPIIDYADYAISTEVIEHVEEPDRAVRCLYDSLSSGGVALLTTPYLDRVPSEEHVWIFDFNDIEMFFEDFSEVWMFPYSSGGWGRVGDKIIPPGEPNIILVRAEK